MPLQPNSKLHRLVERDKRDNLSVNASIAPAIDEAEGDHDNHIDSSFDNLFDEAFVYDGLDWERVPHLEKRQKEHARGAP